MGSALLYLAIVVMWLAVLLPMWLRRDRNDEVAYEHPAEEQEAAPGTSTEPDGAAEPEAAEERAPAATGEDTVEVPPEGKAPEHSGAAAPPAGDAPARKPRLSPGRRRARVIARRRRGLFMCVLLLVASVATAAFRLIPWWAVSPAAVVLLFYLALLRAAAKLDQERREREARARAARLRRKRARRRAAMARDAEVVRFETRKRVPLYDQYSDDRRAVGD